MIPAANTDTICAISTAPGVGGIAVARVSGPQAVAIVGKIWQGKPMESFEPRTAHLGNITDSRGELLDSALVTVYRAPASFTGEDVVEISVHGSKWIQQELINTLVLSGCRLAEPGEFTRRAFACGRIDLTEAEGIADMIASSSRAAHRLAVSQMRGDLSRQLGELRDKLLELASLLELELDFAEEDVEFASRESLIDVACSVRSTCRRLADTFASGSAIKEGVPVAIVGRTNVGKSTLLNRLVGEERAIVSDVHGTTRDTVEDTAIISDILFRFIDTAGLRETTDVVESIGIERTRAAAERAKILVQVVDPSDLSIDPSLLAVDDERVSIVVINKADLIAPAEIEGIVASVKSKAGANVEVIAISAKEDGDLSTLHRALTKAVGVPQSSDEIIITNARHYQALVNAVESTDRVIDGLNSGISADFVAQDLRETLHHLGTITGAVTPSDILASIFARFCIGK